MSEKHDISVFKHLIVFLFRVKRGQILKALVCRNQRLREPAFARKLLSLRKCQTALDSEASHPCPDKLLHGRVTAELLTDITTERPYVRAFGAVDPDHEPFNGECKCRLVLHPFRIAVSFETVILGLAGRAEAIDA